MISLSTDQQQAFRTAVQAAAGREEVRQAIHNIYIALNDAISLRKPVCISSGRCCKFDEFGHRLFLTTMEMGCFVHDLEQSGPFKTHPNPGGCPFQVDKLCNVHSIRPFGCRVFFCDSTATEWQQDQYARFQGELKRLHDELEIPYFYVEWRQALSAIRQPDQRPES